jgi:hypothetical protein
MTATKTEFTILEINRAIAVWMQREATVEVAICRPARKIADVLGEMIWTRAETISRDKIQEIQEEALKYLDEALLEPVSTSGASAGIQAQA